MLFRSDFFNLKHGKSEASTVARVAVASMAQSASRSGGERYRANRGGYAGQKYRFERNSSNRGRGSTWRGATGTIPERCFRCHSLFHKSFNCSAVNKVCLNCGGKGHLQRACRSLMRGDSSRLEDERSSDMRPSEIAVVAKAENKLAEKVSGENVSEIA